jgi:hypothetical protein
MSGVSGVFQELGGVLEFLGVLEIFFWEFFRDIFKNIRNLQSFFGIFRSFRNILRFQF